MDAQRAEPPILTTLDTFRGELSIVDVAKGAEPSQDAPSEAARGPGLVQCGGDFRLAARTPREQPEGQAHRLIVIERGAPTAPPGSAETTAHGA